MKYSHLKIKTQDTALDREIEQARNKGFFVGLRSKKLSKSERLAINAETERDLNLLNAGYYEGLKAGIRNRRK